ncbi:MAG: homocysteine S-methyltransferase, partial [Rhodothermales bacterium]
GAGAGGGAGGGADVIACETIPSLPEARALLRLLDETSAAWAWFSFSCRDARTLADGTPLAEACALAGAHPRVAAVGANCIGPELVPELIATLASSSDKPVIIYPNSGEAYNPSTKTWFDSPSGIDLADAAPQWLGQGASCIGGCCRTSPSTIARMRAALIREA